MGKRTVRKFSKRAVAFLLAFCITVGMMAFGQPVEVRAMTTQSAAVQWARSQAGKALDWDGHYGAQCMDLIAFYCQYLGVSPVLANYAKDYTWKKPPSGWQSIQGAAIQAGDIVIWGENYSATGHVAIALSSSTIMEQNRSGKNSVGYTPSPCQESSMRGAYWGVWRPNFNPEVNDTTAPTISNIRLQDINRDGYTVICDVSDNIGVTSVRFPSWNVDTNDVNWLTGSLSGNTATCRVNIADLKPGAVEGYYMTHIYAYDAAGNVSFQVIPVHYAQYIDRTPPEITEVQVKDITSDGYTVTCKAADRSGIDRVQFPTWTTNGGQDDIAGSWQTNSAVRGTEIAEGEYEFRVNTSEHGREAGIYRTHIYAYDTYGNFVSYDVPDVNVPGADLGESFFANINYPYGKLNLGNVEGNMQTIETDGNDLRQMFHFVRQESGAYKIYSLQDGLCLDAANWGTEDGTNIGFANENGGTAQLWYLYEEEEKTHSFAPSYVNKRIDVNGASTVAGANVVIYTPNGSDAQAFQIQKISNVENLLASDIGNDFYARIGMEKNVLKMSDKASEENIGGVQTIRISDKMRADELWHFVRQENGSYVITNEYNGWTMAVEEKEDGTAGICVCSAEHAGNFAKDVKDSSESGVDNAETKKYGFQWYLFGETEGTSFSLVAVLGNGKHCVLELSGTNVVQATHTKVYGQPPKGWQKFSIMEVISYKRPDKPTKPQNTVIEKVSSGSAITWDEVPIADAYDTRMYEVVVYDRDGKIIDGGTVGRTGFFTKKALKDGYRIMVKAINTEYADYDSGYAVTLLGNPPDGTGGGASGNAVDSVILSRVSYTYNGKVQKPKVIVKDRRGKLLKIKKDYTISFPKGMKNVGRYTVTVTLKGNYKGTLNKTFDIIPKGTTLSRVSAKKNGFTVKWKKQASQTSGYEIAYSTSSKFPKKNTKTVTVKKSKPTSKTISKLKAKKKYYVRIRTYKTAKVNGKSTRIYSVWSKVKTVKTKK